MRKKITKMKRSKEERSWIRRRAKRREGLIAGRKVMGRYTMAVFPCHVVTEL